MTKVSLLPADIYQVIDKSLNSKQDKLVLNMLYMPIIGNIAIMLYFKLQSEIVNNNYISSELSHHHLMTSMGISLDNIKEARLRLEGIGLLKTYYLEGNVNSYIYELYSPVSAKEFFSHPIFNVVLYKTLGKNEYNHLFEYFKAPNINLKDYKDITVPFDRVFKSSKYTELEIKSGEILSKNIRQLSFSLDYDFDLLINSIPKNIFNEKCLNKSTRELILNLSFLYEIDVIKMADLIKTSLNEKGNIEKDELRKNVRRYYEFNNDNRLPSLLFKSQPEYLKDPFGDNSKRGKMIKVFENNSPYEFLKAKYKGVKPTQRDMNILEMLLIDLKLNPAVVNVLIDYTLKTNNNKLIKAYIETIAGQWKRSGIETADEAMNFAEKEYKKVHNKNNFKKKKTILPAWFNEETKVNLDQTTEFTEDFKSFIEEFRK